MAKFNERHKQVVVQAIVALPALGAIQMTSALPDSARSELENSIQSTQNSKGK